MLQEKFGLIEVSLPSSNSLVLPNKFILGEGIY